MRNLTRSKWVVAFVPVGIAAVMTPAILLATSGTPVSWSTGASFNAVVHGIESRYHGHANKIPFMFAISGIAGIATHGGVRNLHVAEIEDVEGPVDGEELRQIIEKKAGAGWQRIIRETSREGGEQNLIYVRPEGDHLGMLIVDFENREMNVVQLSMNGDQLAKQIDEHRHHHDANSDDSDGNKPGAAQQDGQAAE